MKKSKVVILLFILVSSLPVTAAAATYYVDPQNGSDTAAGTSGAPWETIPGTRTTDNLGFLRNVWGPSAGTVTQSNKVKCGDTILLKGGTIYSKQNVTNGGAIRIDSSYYTNTCTAANPITIRVATSAQWSGSSGNFVVDGTGVTSATCVFSCNDTRGLMDVEGLSGVVIGGTSTSQQLEVKNMNTAGTGTYRESGVLLVAANFSTFVNEIKAQYISTHDHGGPGFEYCRVKNSRLDHIISYNNYGPGIDGGCRADHLNANVGITNAEAYGNGRNRSTSQSGDGISFQAPETTWVVDSSTHDNDQRGINAGTITGSSDGSADIARPVKVRFRNIRSYFNGRACSHDYPDPNAKCTASHTPYYCCSGAGAGDCMNCIGSGFDVSGDQNVTGGHVQTYVTGGIFWRNLMNGTASYAGVRSDFWHVIHWDNGWNQPTAGDSEIQWDRTSGVQQWHNSIVPKRHRNIFGYNNCNCAPTTDVKPASNWTMFLPLAADTETFSSFWFNGATLTKVGRTYNDILGFTGFNDKIGSAYAPNFVATGNMCSTQATSPSGAGYATCDFHLQSTSDAIDAGGCLFNANGAGTNANTVTVRGNGLSSDPRDYFMEPASYLEAVGDTIRIGASSVKITSMTATSITFTPAATWTNGACIHLPYSGTAPDMGAFEYAGKKPKAPTLNTVRGVP